MKASNISCLISAGPTREYFDPVRFLSNPSSGKMGYAMAEAAIKRGWQVDLVSGPVCLTSPEGAVVHPVITGDDMLREIDSLFDQCHILIMAAAVMDYRPRSFSQQKLKKSGDTSTVELDPVVDILKTVTSRKSNQIVVAFAAETEDLEVNAKKKLKVKNADFIIANHVGQAGSGFESDTTEVTLLSARGESNNYGPDSKKAIADILIERLAHEFNT